MSNFAAAVVFLHDAFGLANDTIREVLSAFDRVQLPLDEALVLTAADLERLSGLHSLTVRSLLAGDMETATNKATALMARGFRAITCFDAGYPAQLKARGDSPPILYVRGEPALLTTQGFAFAGARNVSPAGLEATRALAEDAVHRGWQVISGGAAGVDTRAHLAALEARGLTTFVLPEGALKTSTRPEVRAVINKSPNSALFVSQYPPTMPWAVRLAMMRNRTIISLARALVVIEAGLESGGTWQAGVDAHKMGVPVYVAVYKEPASSAAGNGRLIERFGGIPVNESNGWRLPDPVVVDTGFKQLGLFGG